MAVNKVVFGSNTIIDITDTTATASDVAQGKYFYTKAGVRTEGAASGGGAAIITDTTDVGGGTIRTITTAEEYYIQQSKTVTPTDQVQVVTPDTGYDALASVTVNAGGGGGEPTIQHYIRFIDYDGTVLHEYTPAQFSALSALPPNPSHSGLTAQGWNWTKQQIDDYLDDYDGDVTVGQMYITDDGKTRIYIHLGEERKSPMLSLRTRTASTVDVDWGDGSTHDTLTSTKDSFLWTPNHEYASGGDYVIKLTVVSGSAELYGNAQANNFSTVLRYANGPDARNNYYTSAITKIEIGTSTTISAYAFTNCYSLKYITIPSGAVGVIRSLFQYCYSLISLTLPDDVTEIGMSEFANCSSCTSVAVPSGVTSIGSNAFQNCYSLTSLTIPDGVTSIEDYVFQYCHSLTYLTIPDGVTSIGSYAFSSCQSIRSLAIPDGVTSIESNAFQNCYSLTSLTIPDGVTSIDLDSLFSGCSALTSLTLPSVVTSIGNYAFSGCTALASLTIPDSVTSIGSNAFQNCRSLTPLTIPDGVTSIGNYTFSGCTSLTSLIIPDSVTSIGTYAFQNCYSLASLTLPSAVTSIGVYAFRYCYALASLTIPDSVTSIGNYAFQYCYSLASLTIPDSVTSIGSNAFQYCYGIAEYHFLPDTPPSLSATSAFNGISSDCKIYVPYSADHSILEAYQTAANWSTYASYMVEEEP